MPLAEEFQNYDKADTLWDRETWEALFGEAARASQSTAGSVALLLKDILFATAGGRKNIEKLRNTAKDGIEWVWPFTQEHELSFKAFLYSIEGIIIGREPIDMLERAIAEADAHLAGEDSPEGKDRTAWTHNNAYSAPDNMSKAEEVAGAENPKRSAEATTRSKSRKRFVAKRTVAGGKVRSRSSSRG
ncbi:MAG TPA: hypothetical protein VJX67_07720 [Blastocatellia bacterium]|nr:hypothetical protein [Blastocatellia bacterium]